MLRNQIVNLKHRFRLTKNAFLKISFRVLSSSFLWSIATIVCLSISVALLIDVSTRFLSGDLGTLSLIAVIFQALVTLISSGSLSTPGRKFVHRFFKLILLRRYFWKASEFGLSLLALGILIYFRLSLGYFAALYSNYGIRQYTEGRVNSAKSSFEMALRLNPDSAAAHDNIGRIYDDQQDYELAKQHYISASQAGSILAHSKLARLYILEGGEDNYEQAVFLLFKGLSLMQSQNVDKRTKYNLLKNLGWVRFHQERYGVAEKHLQIAIRLIPEKAPAYCIYAQTLEYIDGTKDALFYWQQCLNHASSCRRDEDIWIGLASSRLDVQEPQPQECPNEDIHRLNKTD